MSATSDYQDGMMDVSNTVCSRRGFTVGAMAAGALAALGLAGCAPQGKGSSGASSQSADDIEWDEETEVLVVGSGYTGLAAAYESSKAGAATRVIEKCSMMGGNSAFADGAIAVVGSEAQKAMGIEDSVDAFVNDVETAGLGLNYEDKVVFLAEHSNETLEWTINEIGVQWISDESTGLPLVTACGGHSINRNISVLDNSGNNIITPLAEKLSEAGVEVETGMQLVKLIRNGDGRVVGATVAKGCKDYDPDTASSLINIKTTRGVVLATGGFGKDVEYRSTQDPRLGEEVGSTNFEGATSHGLRVALDAGALGVQLDQIQCYPYTSPEEEAFGCAATWIEVMTAYVPTINPVTGKRFINELCDRRQFSEAIFDIGTPVIQIASIDNVPDLAADSLEDALAAGVTREFDTLDEIAAEYGMPVDALKEQMDSYNACVEAGVDAEFGKTIQSGTNPTVTAPYYVTRAWPKVHHCMGGVKADLDCRVYGNDLQPIVGLYAAGEATGGIHGACRLSSNSTLDCLCNGRVAGQKAAANEPLS